jgi:hypothetical protein
VAKVIDFKPAPPSQCNCIGCVATRLHQNAVHLRNYNREQRWFAAYAYAQIITWFAIAALIGSVIIMAWPAWALEHGWDKESALSQWFQTLYVPDDPIPPRSLCCGQSDAYKIRIIEDALDNDNRQGLAEVTDGAERHFADHTIRPGIPNGTQFKFPRSKVNPPSDGNPTDSAWAFFRIWTRPDGTPYIGHVYCVVPLPPGS